MLDFSFEPYRHEMVEVLKNFLKIKSVKTTPQPNMPYGKGIFDALMFVQSTAERMDLECVNLFGHMAYVDYGDGDQMLGILTHIDVVPAGDGWTMGAFSGTEKDGRIYGRGAIDNKGPAIASLYAIKALSDNCTQLNKKVRLIFGADEESGWDDMEFYKKHESLPDIAFSPDGEYPVINAEKGLLHIELSLNTSDDHTVKSIFSGTRVNVVPNMAYCVLDVPAEHIQKALSNYVCPLGSRFVCEEQKDGLVRVTANGKSAHGSRPQMGVNAAGALLQFLKHLSIKSGLGAALDKLADKIGIGYHGEALGLDIEDAQSGRLTLNLGTLFYEKETLKIGIDIRYPVSYRREQIEEKIEQYFADFDIAYVHALDPHFVSEDNPLVVTLKQAYSEITGTEAYCIPVGGATYARAFENAVTFGPVFPGQPSVEHGPDEYIEVDSLMKNAQIIANAIIKLCG